MSKRTQSTSSVIHHPIWGGPEEVSEEMRKRNEEGVGLVLNVADDGPAAKSGFQDGDVLLKMGSQMWENDRSGWGWFDCHLEKLRCWRRGSVCCFARWEQITINMIFGEHLNRR